MKYIVGILAVVGFAVMVKLASFFIIPGSSDTSEVIFRVPPGSSYTGTINKLKKENLVSGTFELRLLGKLYSSYSNVKVGEYRLTKNMTPIEILDILKSGKSIQYALTIPEGYNIFEIASLVELKGFGSAQKFLELCYSPQFAREVLGVKAYSLEGYLFPETYNITRFTTEKNLIKQMVKRFKVVFNNELKEFNKNSIYTKNLLTPSGQVDSVKALILASIVEKETGAPEERPLISSVFHNRLLKNMRLQTDPTVLYGILDQTKKMKKNITKKDLTTYTKYNTYRISGLPHGPISNPGVEAIKAVLNPPATEYLYFVSKNEGRHKFSKTYKEHWEAVKKYQLDRKARKGKSWRSLKK